MKPEESLHRACADLLRLHESRGDLAWAHVPNGGWRTATEAGVFRALGVRPGVSDLLVWLPGGRTLGVELKAGTNPLSPAQQAWHARMAQLGHPVSVARSVADLQRILGAHGVIPIGRLSA